MSMMQKAISRVMIVSLVLAYAPQVFSQKNKVYLFVFPFKNQTKQKDNATTMYLWEKFKSKAAELSRFGVHVITDQNIRELLGEKTAEECIAQAQCEADVAVEVSAQYYITGKLFDVGPMLSLMVKTYETATKRELSSQEFMGKDLVELTKRIGLAKAGDKLFLSMIRKKGRRLPAGKSSPASNQDWFSDEAEKKVINFDSTPPGAFVELDEKVLCQTPCSRSISLGKHLLSMKKPEYHPLEEIINLGKEDDGTIKRILKPAFGVLKLSTKPEGASVYVGKRKHYGVSPIDIKLPQGVHDVRVSGGKHYHPKTREVEITEGETSELSVELKPRQGGLKVSLIDLKSNDIEAKVYSNGKHIGSTPFRDKHITGKTKIKLVYDDQNVFEDEITIQEKKVFEIKAVLPKSVKVKPTFADTYKLWSLRSKLGIGGTAILGIAFLVLKKQADDSFSDYKNSTDREQVDKLRKETSELDTKKQIAGGLLALSSAFTIWSLSDDNKVKAYYSYHIGDDIHGLWISKYLD